MPTTGFKGNSTVIKYGDVTSPPTSSSYASATSIAQCRNISGGEGSTSKIDITTFDDGNTQVSLAGLTELGEISLDFVWNETVYKAMRAIDGVDKTFYICYNNPTTPSTGRGTVIAFKGQLSGLGVPNTAVNEAVTFTAKIVIGSAFTVIDAT